MGAGDKGTPNAAEPTPRILSGELPPLPTTSSRDSSLVQHEHLSANEDKKWLLSRGRDGLPTGQLEALVPPAKILGYDGLVSHCLRAHRLGRDLDRSADGAL
jgi:hypothetical protein